MEEGRMRGWEGKGRKRETKMKRRRKEEDLVKPTLMGFKIRK